MLPRDVKLKVQGGGEAVELHEDSVGPGPDTSLTVPLGMNCKVISAPKAGVKEAPEMGLAMPTLEKAPVPLGSVTALFCNW